MNGIAITQVNTTMCLQCQTISIFTPKVVNFTLKGNQNHDTILYASRCFALSIFAILRLYDVNSNPLHQMPRSCERV